MRPRLTQPEISVTVVWTTGVRASSLTEQIPGERDSYGRLHVDSHLKVIGQEDMYATGDVAYAATDDIGNYALMTCQHAIALGRHAGNNVTAHLLGVDPTPYSQPKYVPAWTWAAGAQSTPRVGIAR